MPQTKGPALGPGPHRRLLNERNRIDVSYLKMEEGTEALRVLARLIARRLQREDLQRAEFGANCILNEENQEEEARS